MRDLLVEFTLSLAPEVRKREVDVVNKQCIAKLNKREVVQEKFLIAAQREYATVLNFLDMYYLPACWKDVGKYRKGFDTLESKTAKLDAVKEQLQIRTVGFGCNNPHHP